MQDPARLRPVEVPAVMADCRKFQARTGWAPVIPFEQSLADVLDYWREQVRTGATDPDAAGDADCGSRMRDKLTR